eukprot:CAMPEP_0117519506 /NCGR_PEP_ID=MMETSP0784-20121206/32686_1 /TAXON_ID=39447 /ORGANISM="" /LENGTH=490 /DNA_ID=CAMNT_0005315467 /DNA_START=52 /DNA_END=1521 /DNA_ORIENTATION=-
MGNQPSSNVPSVLANGVAGVPSGSPHSDDTSARPNAGDAANVAGEAALASEIGGGDNTDRAHGRAADFGALPTSTAYMQRTASVASVTLPSEDRPATVDDRVWSYPDMEGGAEDALREPTTEVGYYGEVDDHGLRSGAGVQTWPNGRRYAGQFDADMFEGEAVMRWPQGHVYMGQYRESCKHGDGRFMWPDGRVYDGQWQAGMRHGAGRFIGSEGYSGDFVDGRRHGDGVLTWADGRRYAGQFVNGCFQGDAAMSWPDGRRYFGQYVDNRRHGEGLFMWPDGRFLEGEWRKGVRHGDSFFVDEHGCEHMAVWHNDQLVSVEMISGDAHEVAQSTSSRRLNLCDDPQVPSTTNARGAGESELPTAAGVAPEGGGGRQQAVERRAVVAFVEHADVAQTTASRRLTLWDDPQVPSTTTARGAGESELPTAAGVAPEGGGGRQQAVERRAVVAFVEHADVAQTTASRRLTLWDDPQVPSTTTARGAGESELPTA